MELYNQAAIPRNVAVIVRSVLSAAVYAFTGWPARQVLDAARNLVDNRPHMAIGPSAEAPLSDDALISVGYIDVIIDANRPLPTTTGQR